jgi:RNA polymerase sigma factor (sigma-70 family)
MTNMEIPSDSSLVDAFRAGDRDALAGIYDRYADRIYSYCLTMLRHPEDAADAAHDTFLKAATRLDQLNDPDRLRPWLFAIARNEARGTGRQRSRVQPAEDAGDTLVDDPDLAMAMKQQELRELVLDAAEGLGPRDRELLALHLTEGLEGSELAEAMGVEPSHLHVMVSRMKDRVEKALGALLIARLGNEDCEELGRLLEGWDGRFSPDIRSQVTRHVSGCELCQERRAFLLAPANVLPGIMLVPAPAALRGRVLRSLEEPLVDPGTPIAARLEWRKWAVLGAVALVLGLIGTAISASFEPITAPATTQALAEAPTTMAAGTTIPSTLPTGTTSIPGSSTTSQPGAPAAIEVSTTTLDFGDEGTSAEFEIANTGGTPGDWALAATSDALAVSLGSGTLGPGDSTAIQVSLDRTRLTSEGELAESLTVTWAGGEIVVAAAGTHEDNPIIHNPRVDPAQIQFNDPGCPVTQTTVSARIRDTSRLASVIVRWSPDGSGNVETPMNPVGNDMFEAVIGPFSTPQTAEVRIVAFDEHDNAGGADIPLEVVSCF